MVESVCVKCAKPVHLEATESIARCPWCKDFFKPLAELIVLHEERLFSLKRRFPTCLAFDKIWILRSLQAIFAAATLWTLWGLVPVIALQGLVLFIRNGSVGKEVSRLQVKISELLELYSREES